MPIDETVEVRRNSLNRVDELQRRGRLSKEEARRAREALHTAVTFEEVIEACDQHLPDWVDQEELLTDARK